MNPRILILTNGHLCRNPRVLKEANTLATAGMDVTVIGVRNHPASDSLDADLMQSAPFRLTSLNLLPGAGPRSFASRLEIKLHRTLARRPGWQTIHSLGPARRLLTSARRHSADLVIVHNEIAHWVGVRLLTGGRHVAADIEDWHSEDLLPSQRQLRPTDLLREMERQLLRECAYTTTTSHALAEALHNRYGGRRPEIITNSFPLQPTPRCCQPNRSGSVVRLFWFSQTLGPGRGLEEFVAVWSQLSQETELTFLSEDRSGFRYQLLARMPPSRRASVRFCPLVPPDRLPEEIARHDVGLALEDSSIPSRNLTITNKILQYLNAGLAILATPTAGQREVLTRVPDAGLMVDLSNVSVETLVSFLSSGAKLALRQQLSRQLAESYYCWELESPRLVTLVRSVLE